MDAKRSKAALLEFLDYLATKGLMAPATARARKAAAGKVLGILSAEEAEDVTDIDLDEVMIRFSNLEGKSYTPDSMVTYKSRVKSALEDFASYVNNPLGFKPGLQQRERKPSPRKSTPAAADSAAATGDTTTPRAPASVAGPMSSSILPIPVRADLTVYVQGLPFDLTPSEAKKIANVVIAMAVTD